MPGLIENQIDSENPLDGVGYDPEKIELDPTKDTVEGRLEGIISKNSPLMQQAATRAKQGMNRKGTLNSSMAVGAAHGAVMDRATPIASQDAQTSFQSKALNQEAGNEAMRFGAESANQFGLQRQQSDLQMERDLGLADIQEERDQRLADIERERDILLGEQQMELQGLRGEQAEQLATIENEYGSLRRASESASSFYNQTAAAIGNILSNPDMSPGAKDTLISKQLKLLENGLGVIGAISNLDFSGLLDFGGGGGSGGGGGLDDIAAGGSVEYNGRTYTEDDIHEIEQFAEGEGAIAKVFRRILKQIYAAREEQNSGG